MRAIDMDAAERLVYSTVEAALALARLGIERTPEHENRCRLYASAVELLLKPQRQTSAERIEAAARDVFHR